MFSGILSKEIGKEVKSKLQGFLMKECARHGAASPKEMELRIGMNEAMDIKGEIYRKGEKVAEVSVEDVIA
ncbi:MAG TPA: hypothetical protein VEA37_04920 [Flavobacterium sp.]|nr:hypothetical protein [Flavobacterium sp.]